MGRYDGDKCKQFARATALNEERLEKTKKDVLPEPPDKKKEAFKRMAPKRVAKVLDSIRVFGHLGNDTNYHYESAEFKAYLDKIRAALSDIKFKGRGY